MNCPSEDTLARFLDEQLSVDETRALELHVQGCDTCSERTRQTKTLLEDIAAPAHGESSSADFVRSVTENITDEPAPAWRWGRFVALAACVLLVIGGVGLGVHTFRSDRGRIAAPPKDPGRFTARGDRAAPLSALSGVEPYIVSGRNWRLLRPDAVISPHEGIAFKYTNFHPRPLYLMAFGLDRTGQVHWFYPAYLHERQNPAAVRIQSRVRDRALPEVVQPEGCPPGRLRIVAVLSPRRRTVKEVEYTLKGLTAKDSLANVFSEAVVQQWQVVMQSRRRPVSVPADAGKTGDRK